MRDYSQFNDSKMVFEPLNSSDFSELLRPEWEQLLASLNVAYLKH